MTATAAALPPLKSVEGLVPYETFAQMRGQGDFVWDEAMQAWIATSFEACQQVFRKDKENFFHPDALPDSEYRRISEGRRHPKTLDGEEHARVHQWLTMRFSPRKVSDLRENVIREVINRVIDGFAGSGKADLAKDFAENIPITVIAAVLDLPFDDEKWVATAKAALDGIGAYYNKRAAGNDDLARGFHDSFYAMRALLEPIMLARKDGQHQDIISEMWRDGPGLLDNWSIEDIFINLQGLFIGGYDTTTMAISNACKLLTDDPALCDAVRAAVDSGDDATLRRFVEEVLRMLPPVQYRMRIAKHDVEICGRQFRAGDRIVPLLASANHDPAKYEDPDDVVLDRKAAHDHMTFAVGNRVCPGAGLARAEVTEAVRILLQRLPDVRRDPDGPPPVYHGLTLRRWYPVNVVFTPTGPGN